MTNTTREGTGAAPGGRSVLWRAVAGVVAVAVGVALIYAVDPVRFYLWIKAFHVIAVIAWMAGMLYLPRLFVYHCAAAPGSEQSETFKVMERKLLRLIINPAMIVVWVLGLWLAWRGGWIGAGWLDVKVAAVLLLSAVHGYYAGAVRAFAEDRNKRSARHWRFMNEVPTLLMIVIVVMAVVKPF